jgi:predicted enzyme related to lactoylglutathione lyase
MFTPTGKFGWYELMTSDLAAAARFYSDVVGWTTQQQPSTGGFDYTTFNLDSVGIAGMLDVGGHTAWIGYIAVKDVDAHIEQIVQAGGKLWKPAADVPGMLRFAVLSDPQGAPFVIFTPNPAMPTPVRPAPPTPGTVSWQELYTSDLEAGFDFYQKLFGWTKLTDMDMGPAGIYRLFDQGDHLPMGAGGMMAKPAEFPSSCWMFYFQVGPIHDAVQRVQAGGGTIWNGPTQVPGGGWIVNARDPQGAMFSLVGNAA